MTGQAIHAADDADDGAGPRVDLVGGPPRYGCLGVDDFVGGKTLRRLANDR